MSEKKTEKTEPTVKDAFEKSLTGIVRIDSYPYNGMELHIKDIKIAVGKTNAFNVYFSELENGIPNIKAGDDPANYNPVLISGTHLLLDAERSKIIIGAEAGEKEAEEQKVQERKQAEEVKKSEIDEIKEQAKVEQEAAVKKAVAEALKGKHGELEKELEEAEKKHNTEIAFLKKADTGAVKTKQK